MTMRLLSLAALLALLVCPAYSQRRKARTNYFKQFVTRLPEVDRVEILTVSTLQTDDPANVDCSQSDVICSANVFPLRVAEVKTVTGDEALKLASIWRKLKRGPHDPCFAPDRVLRFFSKDKLLLSSAVNVLRHEITIPQSGVVNVSDSMYEYYKLQRVLMPDESFESRFEGFKQKMMPQVGKTITVMGVLESGKLGWRIPFQDWGIYLYSHTNAGLAKQNDLNRFYCDVVRVTGTLRYFPKPSPLPPGGRVVAQAPEHFYMELEEVQVVRVRVPRSSQKKLSSH